MHTRFDCAVISSGNPIDVVEGVGGLELNDWGYEAFSGRQAEAKPILANLSWSLKQCSR